MGDAEATRLMPICDCSDDSLRTFAGVTEGASLDTNAMGGPCSGALGASDSSAGTVTDAANEPLIGASVLVQGTSTGTITDMDGKYSISVTPEDVLAFSYVGMTSQTIKVGTQNVINVTLK